AGPFGFALLEERTRTFLRIVSVRDALTERLGEELGFVERQPEPFADRKSRSSYGEWRIAVDQRGDLACSLRKAFGRDELCDEAEVVRPLRTQPLVPSRERDPHRDVERKHTREAHDLAARHQTDADVRVEALGSTR